MLGNNILFSYTKIFHNMITNTEQTIFFGQWHYHHGHLVPHCAPGTLLVPRGSLYMRDIFALIDGATNLMLQLNMLQTPYFKAYLFDSSPTYHITPFHSTLPPPVP